MSKPTQKTVEAKITRLANELEEAQERSEIDGLRISQLEKALQQEQEHGYKLLEYIKWLQRT